MDCPWNTDSLKGCRRFIDKIIRLKDKVINDENYSKNLEIIINKSIKKVQNDLYTMGFNTAISTLMILANKYDEHDHITKKDYKTLLTLLNPIAPHITEELNEELGYRPICESSWPTYDEEKTIDISKKIAVQINGKVRAAIDVLEQETAEEIKEKALKEQNVQKYLEGKEIIKEIIIPNKIVNFVTK